MAPIPSKYILTDLPFELLSIIIDMLETPLDDITPLDQNSFSSIKNLSLVNKGLREFCLTFKLRHVRMWKKEENLAEHLDTMHRESKDILRSAR